MGTHVIQKKENVIPAVYLGWVAIALFFFYQYILRVAPGVLVTDLRETFHLTAEQFATLGAFYLYAYSLCQIPVGVIVDYVGARKTVLTSIVLCLLGALLFAQASNLWTLQLSRVLIGIGSACAFMCSVKIIVDYLPQGKRGFLMGATLTLGTFGALTAGKPLALMADLMGFRETVLYAMALGVIVFLLAFLFLPIARKENLVPVSHRIFKNIYTSLIEIFKTRPLMIYALLAIGVYTPLSVLADLWGVAFLMQKYNLSRVAAADISMMMYFGLGVGSLILPWLSEKYNFLNRSIQICTFGVLCLFAVLLYGPSFSPITLKIILTTLGVFCAVEMLCFAGASLYTNAGNVGTTIGVVNTFNMLGGGLLQQLIGWTLDKLWSGAMTNGVRLYSTIEYSKALTVLFFVVAICCLLSLWLPKDRQC
jgi:sugar phosphate permease